CWGGSRHGQLGVDPAHADGAPAAVAGLTGVVQIAAGDGATCAVRKDGSVWCWGDNTRGLLGDMTGGVRWRPAAVPRLAGATEAALAYDHGCARLGDGTVKCWGAMPPPGAPSQASTVAGAMPATALAGVADVDGITAGYSGVMLRKKDGSLVTMFFDAGDA